MNILILLFCCVAQVVSGATASQEEPAHRTVYDAFVNVKAALARTKGGNQGERWAAEADAAVLAEEGGDSTSSVLVIALLLLLGVGFAGYRYREEISAKITAMTSPAPITTQHND